MEWPEDGAMLALLAISLGERFEVTAEGWLAVTMPIRDADGRVARGVVPCPEDRLDTLEARGWIRIVEAGAEVTEAGRYWLDRWMRLRYEKGRLIRVDRMTARYG